MNAGRFPTPYTVTRPLGRSPVVLICEHASAAMPEREQDLGLAPVDRLKHIAWDLGALGVAQAMSACLDAPLLACNYSRLLVDCNRFPDAEDAFICTSDGVVIPGNQALSVAEREARLSAIHTPFHAAAKALMDAREAPVLVAVHSFTPVYEGQVRDVELGLLADQDESLARAMWQHAPAYTSWDTRVNEPYDANSGVSYTARTHALARGVPHVLLEVRQDLIAQRELQRSAGEMLSRCLTLTLYQLGRTIVGGGA